MEVNVEAFMHRSQTLATLRFNRIAKGLERNYFDFSFFKLFFYKNVLQNLNNYFSKALKSF